MNAEQHLNSESHRVDFNALKLNKPVLYNEIIRVMESYHRYKVESVTDEMIDNSAIEFCQKYYPDYSDITKETEVFDAGAEWLKQELKK